MNGYQIQGEFSEYRLLTFTLSCVSVPVRSTFIQDLMMHVFIFMMWYVVHLHLSL